MDSSSSLQFRGETPQQGQDLLALTRQPQGPPLPPQRGQTELWTQLGSRVQGTWQEPCPGDAGTPLRAVPQGLHRALEWRAPSKDMGQKRPVSGEAKSPPAPREEAGKETGSAPTLCCASGQVSFT